MDNCHCHGRRFDRRCQFNHKRLRVLLVRTQSDQWYRSLAFFTATSGSDAVGVYGEVSASGGRGVVGRAIHPTGSNVGIYGETASPNGYAGYFVGPVVIQGPLGVNGDLVVSGAKFFQIDHPLDPDSKWLRHAVESPGMLNLYNGNVVLDENGESWVQLPDYFEALNQDFRYQLTAMGAQDRTFTSQKRSMIIASKSPAVRRFNSSPGR